METRGSWGLTGQTVEPTGKARFTEKSQKNSIEGDKKIIDM